MSKQDGRQAFRHTQFGCGLCAPAEWTNFDVSPSLRLQQLPLIGALVPSGPFGRFPANVRYGDIVQGLPVPDGSVELLYCSHVLEHLALADLRRALANCRRLLAPGAVFRLVVPDLAFFIRQYQQSPSTQAAPEFMRNTYLGRPSRRRDLAGFVQEWLGASHHLWMWDFESLSAELEAAGLRNIRRACYGDSGLAAFALVEDAVRWQDALGVHCTG